MGRLQNNPSIGWVNPKSTHAHPLTGAIKNLNTNLEPYPFSQLLIL
jgi:hypothetical protein